MAYSDKNIKRDLTGDPVPQYYNPSTDDFEPLEGEGGASKTQLTGSDVTVGGATLTLEGTQLSGVYADRPTVAQAQAAVGVTYPVFYATDTGTSYAVSGSAWVVM